MHAGQRAAPRTAGRREHHCGSSACAAADHEYRDISISERTPVSAVGPRTWCYGWTRARRTTRGRGRGRGPVGVRRGARGDWRTGAERQRDERFIQLLEDNLARHQRILEMLRDEHDDAARPGRPGRDRGAGPGAGRPGRARPDGCRRRRSGPRRRGAAGPGRPGLHPAGRRSAPASSAGTRIGRCRQRPGGPRGRPARRPSSGTARSPAATTRRPCSRPSRSWRSTAGRRISNRPRPREVVADVAEGRLSATALAAWLAPRISGYRSSAYREPGHPPSRPKEAPMHGWLPI